MKALKNQLRTFRFMRGVKFDQNYTTIRVLEDYILTNIPTQFHHDLLNKNNSYYSDIEGEPRLKTLIKEFFVKYNKSDHTIKYITITSEAFQALEKEGFCNPRDRDRRNKKDDTRNWLMLIPKQVAIYYIKQLLGMAYKIECSDETVVVKDWVEFSLPLTDEPKIGLPLLMPGPKKTEVFVYKNDIIKNNSSKEKLYSKAEVLYLGKANYELLGKPSHVRVERNIADKGKLMVKPADGSLPSDIKVAANSGFIIQCKNLSDFIGISVEKDKYYPVELFPENQYMTYDFNNPINRR